MSTIDRLAEKLAEDTMEAMDALGEDRLYVEIGDVLAAASQSLEEAYLTEMRVRIAERTARRVLDAKLAQARKLRAAAAAQPAAPGKPA